MKHLAMLAVLVLVGCGGETEPEAPAIGKGDVAAVSGKGDTADLDRMCEDLGREPGCDPCSIQGWYGDGSCDDFCPVRDADCGIDGFAFNVEVDAGMSASVALVYQATKDSFGCTDLTFDGLSPKRVPEQIREEVAGACVSNADETSSCEFTFDNEHGDGCLSVIRHIYLNPSDAAGTMETWASLEFSLDAELAADSVEVVECEEILSGPGSSTPMMMCGIDLLHYTAAGTANVSLALQEP